MKNQTIANGSFVATGVADEDDDWIVVRIFTTTVTHVVLDLTGVTVFGISGARSTALGTASQQKAAKSNRMGRALPRS